MEKGRGGEWEMVVEEDGTGVCGRRRRSFSYDWQHYAIFTGRHIS